MNVRMSKIIYLGTTYQCSACKCQEVLLKSAIALRPDIKVEVYDYKELPEWIKINVKLTDFPVTILVDNDVIKYHFVGTKTISKSKKLIQDINY